MKRLIVVVIFLLLMQTLLVGAYDIQVQSFSESEIILSLTDIKTVDIKASDVKATVESASLSDTYAVEATLETKGEEILMHIDISPIFQDYSPDQIKSITVSGFIEIEGDKIEFGKRVPLRQKSSSQKFAAPQTSQESPTLIYWILGLCIVLVILILLLFFKKPKAQAKKISKKKILKKKKPLVKKKKTTKKSKKRL